MSGGPAPEVVTLGEPLAVFAADLPRPLDEACRFTRFCAGAELNVAIGLARLGYRVGYLSRVGGDSTGRFLMRRMAEEGIDLRAVAVDEDLFTGFMFKSRAVDGRDPDIEYRRRGSAASRMTAADLERLDDRGARHLHLTAIVPALSEGCRELAFAALRRARSRGMAISFDPNLRPQLWPSVHEMCEAANAMAAQADVVLPGLAEGERLTGASSPQEIARCFLDLGARQVVVKLGADGAWCADRHGLSVHVPGLRVDRVVDTVGAGDGFAVGLVSGLLEGLPLPRAAERGNAVAARVIQHPGDADGLPRRHELPLPGEPAAG